MSRHRLRADSGRSCLIEPHASCWKSVTSQGWLGSCTRMQKLSLEEITSSCYPVSHHTGHFHITLLIIWRESVFIFSLFMYDTRKQNSLRSNMYKVTELEYDELEFEQKTEFIYPLPLYCTIPSTNNSLLFLFNNTVSLVHSFRSVVSISNAWGHKSTV